MKIPAEIVPCPITEAVMEVRFESNFDEAAVFGIIYNQLKEEYTKTINLPILEIPSSLRKGDPSLMFLPHYRLVSKSNENSLIQIGPRVFSVIVTNNYPGWKSFLPQIAYGLDKLEKSNVVSKITRFALRYVNFFPENILLKSNLSIQLNNQSLNSLSSNLRIAIPDGEFLNLLSITNDAIKQEGNGLVKGSTIDIDTIIEKELPNFFKSRDTLIEDCHKAEKKLFANLMAEEYVKSLQKIDYV